MDFNLAYDEWLNALEALTKVVIEHQNPTIEINDKMPDSIVNLLSVFNENTLKYKESQREFYKEAPQALHLACEGQFLALKRDELEKRYIMHQLTNTLPYSHFYGNEMNLVEIIDSSIDGCTQTVIDTVKQLRANGFNVVVKYFAFESTTKHLNSNWGKYYIYANVNDVQKFMCAYSIWQDKPDEFILLVYPRTPPKDTSHLAYYSEFINI